MIMGQVLLLFMISFKRAIFPAILSFITIIPTLLSRRLTLNQYYHAYIDTSLLQTASLDMCDPSKQTSLCERRLFRDFLVDAHKGECLLSFNNYFYDFSPFCPFFVNHKAAYIPVCIAGSTTSILTSEPAVAISTDLEKEEDDMVPPMSNESLDSIGNNEPIFSGQRGAFSRRVRRILIARKLIPNGNLKSS